MEQLLPYIKPILINVWYALGFLVVGVVISRVIAGNITRHMLRSNPSPSTQKMARIVYKMVTTASFICLTLISVSIVGINISLLIGGIGLAIGYAMEEVLGNIFASVMLMTHRHYHVGDLVKIGGTINVLGTIESVSTRITTIKTFDRQRVMIPNLTMIRSAITPYSRTHFARCEGTITIPRDMDIATVRPIITHVINQHPATTATDYTTVLLTDHNEWWSLLTYYHYFNPANEVPISRFRYVSAINQSIHQAFHTNNIHIPYPRRLMETSKL